MHKLAARKFKNNLACLWTTIYSEITRNPIFSGKIFDPIVFSIFGWVKNWFSVKMELSNFTISFVNIWSTYDLHESRLPKMYVFVFVCELSIFCCAITRKRLHWSLWNFAWILLPYTWKTSLSANLVKNKFFIPLDS